MRTKASLVLTVAASILVATTLVAQTESERIEEIGGHVSPPHVIYSPAPDFSDDPALSESARKIGYEGVCTLSLIVGSDGMPRNIRVVNRIGKGLDEKAIEAGSAWRFSPAMRGGQPVAVKIEVEVTFHLYAKPSGDFAYFGEKAREGDAKAQLEFANLLLKQHDSTKNRQVGLGYLEKAANQGLPRAQFQLAKYIDEKSPPADYPIAYMWYTLAQRSGEKHIDKALKQLTAKMSPDQLQAAQALIDAWKPAPPK